MRIGVDARELCGHTTGVGRYLGGLLNQWSADERTRSHEFVLYAPEPLGMTLDGRRFPTRLVAGATGWWWEQVQLPAASAHDHLDVFFSPGYSAPLLSKVPTVVAIHDLSFAARPDWFATREGIRRRWLSRQSALRARAVITISEFSRRELIERFSVPESNIHVIPPGIHRPIHAAGSRSTGVNVLFVGSIFNRRHVPDLIRAFAPIARRHPDARLNVVGENRSYPRQDLATVIAIEGLNGRVQIRPWVSDEELSTLYSSARAFAFLSEYEGLGLTPLEAMASGVPPMLLDTEIARESCGNAALYVTLGDLAGTTDALSRLLFDEPTRLRLLAAAPEVLARYSWPRAARDTLTVIERAAVGKSR